MKKLCLAVAVAVSTVAGPASANLLTNPGFENVFSTAWSGGMGVLHMYEHSGSYAVDSLCSKASSLTKTACSLRQTVATTPGSAYDISFWVYNNVVSGASNQQFRVTFAGVDLGTTSYGVAGVWTQFTLTGFASSMASVFQIYGRNDTAAIFFDDFSIDAAATVPEPATLGLLGLGALGAGLARRRTIRKAAQAARLRISA